jgi:hypothetical protein
MHLQGDAITDIHPQGDGYARGTRIASTLGWYVLAPSGRKALGRIFERKERRELWQKGRPRPSPKAPGEVFRRDRLSQGGKNFYASPVAADGKVFLVDTEGRFTIIKAGREWEELSTTSLDEPCFATPAIRGGRILVRTPKGLYCLGGKMG